MRRTTIGILCTGMLALAGCGGGSKFANHPRPATPVNLSVYINDTRVSVSPPSVGAGPLLFVVTNQASNAESLAITRGGSTVADTGPMSPQGTAQMSVNVSRGAYVVATSPVSGTGRPIRSAVLRIGPARPSSSNQLEQP